MARYYTADRQWRATDILLDGRELIRVQYHGALGWIWCGDYRRIADFQRIRRTPFRIAPDETRDKWLTL